MRHATQAQLGRRTGFEPATSGATIQCSTNCATVSITQFSILGCSWQGTNPTFSRQCCTSSRAHVRAAMPNCMWFNAFCILPFVYYGAEDGIRTRVSTLARSYPCPDWKTSADYGHNACIATARDDGAGGQCWIRTSDAPRDAYPPSKRAD